MWRAQGAPEYQDVNLETSNWDQQTSMHIIDTLVTGQLYEIQIRARNVYGFGPFSDAGLVRASSWPSKPEEPLTTETDGLNVLVTFS
jgi:hypothetical protein